MNHDLYPDAYIRDILGLAKTIAVVGISAKETRPSFIVFEYLLSLGYRMIGVNPGLAGGTLLGAPVYKSLWEIPEPLDMVDIFRNSEAAGAIVDEALCLDPKPKVIWMQLGVRDDAAAARAEAQSVQ
jgi:predicted CoA-binding protein